MVFGSSNSPIDTLLEKNARMAQSSSNGRAASENEQPNDADCYQLSRSKRFGDEFLPPWELQRRKRENEEANKESGCASAKSDQSVLDGLHYLGLRPRNCTNAIKPPASSPSSSSSASSPTASTSSRRKSQTPKKLEETKDDFCFVQANKFPCDYCRKVLYDKTIFRRHTLRHISRLRRCLICQRSFTTKTSYKRHKAFVCKKRKY